ncbi:MAG: ligase-associated DNA damage response exonuclease [Cyclobacteriaceae bacterium]
MSNSSLLEITKKGIYCQKAGIYIDPWVPVKKALITHGHADHARWGHQHYMSTSLTKAIMHHRLGESLDIQGAPYGEQILINGVKFSFHPAGHLPGSAQVRVEHKGEICVASGDYKLSKDPLAEPFEPIKCHTFISECTFGLPVFRWNSHEESVRKINIWWRENQKKGLVSVIGGYALGKAQRILTSLDPSIGPIYTHGAVENINRVLRASGVTLPETIQVMPHENPDYSGSMVIATPSALSSPWMKRFKPYTTALASGWMTIRGARRRRSVDKGFVMSDHADWEELNRAIAETGAENIICTHGYTQVFAQWLRSNGYNAVSEETEFKGELMEVSEDDSKEHGT